MPSATVEEMYSFLDWAWIRCRGDSILYIATDGEAGCIRPSDPGVHGRHEGHVRVKLRDGLVGYDMAAGAGTDTVQINQVEP